MSEPNAVLHNRALKRFELELDDGHAVADYVQPDPMTVVFNRTVVPRKHRGHGIAAMLVKAGLDYARHEKLAVVPQCSYVARFIESHPEYRSLIH